MPETNTCRQCGAELLAQAPYGLCPKRLLADALEDTVPPGEGPKAKSKTKS